MDTILYENKEVFPLFNDVVFKGIFNEKGKSYIRSMLNDILQLNIKEDDDLTLLNTELSPSNKKEKICRLDLVVKTKNELVNVEVQVVDEKNIESRAAYYLCKLHGGSLDRGDRYDEGKRTIVLLILDFNITDQPSIDG